MGLGESRVNFTLSLTRSEYLALLAAAKRAGMTVDGWVRTTVLAAAKGDGPAPAGPQPPAQVS
jgi:hypothetical protein